MQPDTPARPRIVWVGTLFEGGLGLLAWGLGWLLQQPPLERFRWDSTDAWWGVLATVPMLLVFLACVRWPVGSLRRIKQIADEFIRPLFEDCSLPGLALLAAAAGIGEEMLFRGFLQTACVRWLDLWPGVALASVLFGLLHLITPTYAVVASLLGLFLGVVYLFTANLLTVIVAHALYDFLALVYIAKFRRDEAVPGTYQ